VASWAKRWRSASSSCIADEPERYNESGGDCAVIRSAHGRQKFAEQVADLGVRHTRVRPSHPGRLPQRLPADNDKRGAYCTDEAARPDLAAVEGAGGECLLAIHFIDAQFILGSKRAMRTLTFPARRCELDESLQEEDSGITDAEGKDSSENCAGLFKEALANARWMPRFFLLARLSSRFASTRPEGEVLMARFEPRDETGRQ